MTKLTSPVPDRPREPLTILVADDHPVVRCGLVCLLEGQPDFSVVGEAASCSELCAKAVELRPDVVFVDLEMEDTTGAEAVVRLRAYDKGCRVLVYTAREPDYLALEILPHDVQGILVKNAPCARVCHAVRASTRGSLYLDPAVAEAVRRRVAAAGAAACSAAAIELTAREHAVLRRIADGRRNRDIADEFGVSERAVKYYVTSLLAKLAARNRSEAVEKAGRLGLL